VAAYESLKCKLSCTLHIDESSIAAATYGWVLQPKMKKWSTGFRFL